MSTDDSASRRKVLLVDDHEVVRFGVRSLYPELHGVPLQWLEAECLHDALDIYAREGDIDAVLLDLNLPDSKGLQGLRVFLERHPTARIAVFSATQDEFVVRQARALGAVAYVPKGASTSQLCVGLSVLLALTVKATALSPAGELFPLGEKAVLGARGVVLGPLHLEILELVLSGCSNQEISTTMRLSLGTTKNYVSSLLVALEVKSRAHLVSLFR
jgi:DNA-binding NarL/FixJ family response regulator